MIAQYQRGHRFHDRHGAWQHTWIMAAARGEHRLLMRRSNGLLLVRNRCSWLKRDPEINVFAIADAALDTARIICRCPHFAAAHFKWIVVFRAAHSR